MTQLRSLCVLLAITLLATLSLGNNTLAAEGEKNLHITNDTDKEYTIIWSIQEKTEPVPGTITYIGSNEAQDQHSFKLAPGEEKTIADQNLLPNHYILVWVKRKPTQQEQDELLTAAEKENSTHIVRWKMQDLYTVAPQEAIHMNMSILETYGCVVKEKAKNYTLQDYRLISLDPLLEFYL